MDAPNPDINTAAAASASARHAYHTADYKVSKREMAALWNRYYVWKAAKEKDLKRESSSVYAMSSAGAGSRRAYQTSSFEVMTVPVKRSSSHPTAKRAVPGTLNHGPVHKTTSNSPA